VQPSVASDGAEDISWPMFSIVEPRPRRTFYHHRLEVHVRTHTRYTYHTHGAVLSRLCYVAMTCMSRLSSLDIVHTLPQPLLLQAASAHTYRQSEEKALEMPNGAG
jgi:hypothetical protein